MKLFPGRAVWLAFSLVAAVASAAENLPPTVVLDTPAETEFTAPATVNFTASATDLGGQVAKVEFFAGKKLLGVVTNAPYSLTVSNVLFGNVRVRAVATDNEGATNTSAEVALTIRRATSPPMTLQLLHAADFEASVGEVDVIPRFSAVIGALKAQYPTNTLIVSAGNNFIPGPFFTASADPALKFNGVKGRVDITVLNQLGIQASCLGNDEFDDDTLALRNVVLPDAAAGYPGAQFPYLSANLDFSTDSNLADLVTSDGQDSALGKNKIARSTVVTVAGQRIGIVGSTTPNLRSISSPGNVGVSSNLVENLQDAVDALQAQGINKIILLSNWLGDIKDQITLVWGIKGVDVIVAGGSQAIFANQKDHLWFDDNATRYTYPQDSIFGPIEIESPLAVSTGGYYHYVGRLLIQFNEEGVRVGVGAASAPYATDDIGVASLGNPAGDSTIGYLMSDVRAVIDSKDKQRFGRTSVYLNAQRNDVRTEETNLGDLTADANLARARQTDPNTAISLKNGGGMRDSIGAFVSENGHTLRVPPPANPRVGKQAGEVSQLDIENSLRFNNSLTLLTITAQQLRDTMEWAVAAEGTPGQYPQVGGLSFAYQPTNAPMTYERDTNGVPVRIVDAGQRLRSLTVTNANGSLDLVVENGSIVGDSNRTFRVVTIAFMANGGDSYFALSRGTNRVDLVSPEVTNILFDTDGGEQKALADYLRQIQLYTVADMGAAEDKRIQNLAVRNDAVTLPEIVELRPKDPGTPMTFRTFPGKSYFVEKRDSMDTPWTRLGSFTVEGDGFSKTVTDDNPPGVKRFYRVIRTN